MLKPEEKKRTDLMRFNGNLQMFSQLAPLWRSSLHPSNAGETEKERVSALRWGLPTM